MDDYTKFCMKCGWNDPDYGCISPSGEDVWQCDLYRFYHPEEVEQFNRDMEEWAGRKEESEDK